MDNPSGCFTLYDGRKVDTIKYLEECEHRIRTIHGALIPIGRENIAKKAFFEYESLTSFEK